ncbi:uncharacterized protein LOC143219413 [Lasioglossum baleicum]|uniref:uncharacterized protein LOC143219413 n=1 Tax=Lasioglossum baleicum TaxID=434251 RepID=UPI003FCD7358
MPHISLEEVTKLSLLCILGRGQMLPMSFRSWDLYEYPHLQTTTKHTWAIKAVTPLEKPRFIIFALQNDRKNQLQKSANQFNDCKLSNMRLYLNSQSYPYDDLNLDFEKNNEPLLDELQFLSQGPFVVIDCSRQDESVKSATIDVRIDFECRDNVPVNTAVYCLIIHDRIVEYSPLTNVVRRIL